MSTGISIKAACERTGLGRTSLYAAIRDGKLIARKFGRRTIILATDLDRFLAALPARDSDERRGQ